MKLLINNTLIDANDYDGTNGTTFDIAPAGGATDEDGKRVKVGQEYTVRGAAFDIINEFLITPENGLNAFVPVKIYEDKCCDTDLLLFDGIISGDMVDWCHGECEARIRVVEHTTESRNMDCIKSTLVFDNWNGFQEQVHPRIVYCVEMRPDFLQHVVIILGIIVNIILALLTPVIAVVSLIIDGLQAIEDAFQGIGININIAPEFSEDSNLMAIWNNLVESLNQKIIGCGRKHISPFTRSYIQNVCDKCGVNFISSIYNDSNSDYYNSMYLNAPIEKGTRDEQVLWMEQNKVIKTLDLFLDDLVLAHNAEWKLIGNDLYFERWDFFNDGNVWVNFTTLEAASRTVGKLCLSWREGKRPAFGNFQYSEDSVDIVGTEARNRYNDIVEWNLPFSELQSGHEDVLLPFGTPRFRSDGIDEDILGVYHNIPTIVPGSISIGDLVNSFKDVLTLEKGTAFQPKLLIWDGVDINFARIKKYNISGQDIPADENFNYPYLFNEDNTIPNTAYPTTQPNSNLYPRFYSINNPKLIIDSGKDFTFTFMYYCEALEGMLTARFVQLPQGIGRIKKIELDLSEKSITVSGEV